MRLEYTWINWRLKNTDETISDAITSVSSAGTKHFKHYLKNDLSTGYFKTRQNILQQ